MDNSVQERRLLAVLMTDVYGYGAHISRGEEASESRITADLATFAEICAAHHGQVVCDRGDGLKMTFESPVNAMRAALAMQREAFERNAGADPRRRYVRHRMGLHVGDVLISDGRPTGYAVAVAARLEQRALPGEICFSEEVFRAVKPSLNFASRFVGREELKNLRLPVKMWMTMRENPLAVHGAHVASRRTPPPSEQLGWPAWLGLLLVTAAAIWGGSIVADSAGGGAIRPASRAGIVANPANVGSSVAIEPAMAAEGRRNLRGRAESESPRHEIAVSNAETSDEVITSIPESPSITPIEIPRDMVDRARREEEAYRARAEHDADRGGRAMKGWSTSRGTVWARPDFDKAQGHE